MREQIAAGYYSIDIDASTVVDLSLPTVREQQRLNAELTAHFTQFVRGIEPEGVTISLGAEIGEVGHENTTPEELREFMAVYRRGPAYAGAKTSLPSARSASTPAPIMAARCRPTACSRP